MVMLIAGSNAAATPQGNALLQLLDLRAGEPLAVEVRTKFPLAQRRILIRKPFIRELLNDLATEHPQRALQLVSAGAGLAPLALDWCVQFPSARAFELDIDHMPEKQLAIHRVADNTVAARIQCIPFDLTDTAAAAGASVVQCNHPLEMEQRLGIKPIYHHADDSAMRIALLAPKLGV
jgi:hypothetical protein